MHIRHSIQASDRGGISPTNLLLGSMPGKRRPIRNSEELFLEGVNFIHQQAEHRVNCSGLCGLASVPSPEDWALLPQLLGIVMAFLSQPILAEFPSPEGSLLAQDSTSSPGESHIQVSTKGRKPPPLPPSGTTLKAFQPRNSSQNCLRLWCTCADQSPSPSSGQLLLPSLLHSCCLWECSSINFQHTNLHLRVCFLETQSNLAKSKPWLSSTLNLLHAWTHATENSWRENTQASQLLSSYTQAHSTSYGSILNSSEIILLFPNSLFFLPSRTTISDFFFSDFQHLLPHLHSQLVNLAFYYNFSNEAIRIEF